MANPIEWKDEQLNGPPTYRIIDDSGTTIAESARIELSTEVLVPGTPITAATMASLSQSIIDAIAQFDDKTAELIAQNNAFKVEIERLFQEFQNNILDTVRIPVQSFTIPTSAWGTWSYLGVYYQRARLGTSSYDQNSWFTFAFPINVINALYTNVIPYLDPSTGYLYAVTLTRPNISITVDVSRQGTQNA